ncbi:MAG: calcium:cation antiporter [Mycobacteriales bacterium]
MALAVALFGAAGIAHYTAMAPSLVFAVSALAIAATAALVGRGVDQLGDRLGAGATGMLQAALGNLPELLVGVFALRAGLFEVVRAALVGSILGNILLVLGLTILVGGLRHGVQRFSAHRARMAMTLMLLAVAGLLVPSLSSYVHAGASGHESTLSVVAAVVLLAVFAASVPAGLRRGAAETDRRSGPPPRWPRSLAIAVLAAAALLAAFVSAWFVDALEPTIHAWGLSQAFAGLVVVALAGNVVENVVAVALAAKNDADYALALVLASPQQIALVAAPVFVLISYGIAPHPFTLVFSPLLVTTLATSVVAVAFVTFDGEWTWLEGVSLLGLYCLIAASLWWG